MCVCVCAWCVWVEGQGVTIRGRTPGEGEGTGDGVQGGTIRWWIQGDQLSQPHFDLLPVLDMIVAFLTGSRPPVRMAEWP